MKTLAISIKIFILLTIITGLIYPLVITGIAQSIFTKQANGSLIVKNGEIIGSVLIGQQFDTAVYFNSRPSAAAYNALASGGSNYSLSNNQLKKQVAERKQVFYKNNMLIPTTKIPAEMLFASASGLDPHISPEAALLQANRISKASNLNIVQTQKLISLIHKLTEQPQLNCLGEKRINVLLLNLELDKLR